MLINTGGKLFRCSGLMMSRQDGPRLFSHDIVFVILKRRERKREASILLYMKYRQVDIAIEEIGA